MAAAQEASFGEDSLRLTNGLETLRNAYLEAGLKWKAKALRAKLNRLAWKSLAEDAEWLKPMAETQRLSRKLSPTGFFVMMFIAVGLVVAPLSGAASLKVGRRGESEDRDHAEGERPLR